MVAGDPFASCFDALGREIDSSVPDDVLRAALP